MIDLKLLHEAFRNDQSAVNLILNLLDVVATIETLQCDITVPTTQLEDLLWIALVEIPSNPLYRRVGDRLQPMIQQALLNLRVERPRSSNVAIERRVLVDIAVHLSMLCGGPKHAMLYANLLHENFHAVPVEPLPELEQGHVEG